MSETQLLLEGLGLPESTRWRDGRVWLCNWGGAGEVLAVAMGGERQLTARLAPKTLPFSIDWLPDGRLLSSTDRTECCCARSRMVRSRLRPT
jgi:hypothetical protein